MTCDLCKADPQPEGFGQPRKCAFPDRGNLNRDNWNCRTMNILRSSVVWGMRDDGDSGSIGVLQIPDCCEAQGYLVMTWYKERGRTPQARLMNDDETPKLLNLATAMEIVAALEVGT